MGGAWKFKDEVFLIAGGIVFVIGALFVAVSAYMITEEPGTGVFAVILFFVILVLPGILLIRHSRKLKKKQEKLEKIKLYLSRNRRIKISRLSEVIGESELDTLSILEEGMKRGMYDGSYDEENGEKYFVYSDYSIDSDDYSNDNDQYEI